MRLNKKSIVIIALAFIALACGRGEKEAENEGTNATTTVGGRKARFSGNYNLEFNDLQDAHAYAALKNGIAPLQSRSDTINLKKELVRLPDVTELYEMYELKHSVPFLVPSAAALFTQIALNFRDSLYKKDLPLYKIYATSILRTKEDLTELKPRNINASENSAHLYATTFDISWKRFVQVDADTTRVLPADRLKLILAQVLFDLRNQNRCYVKHERRQACFHITVRG